MAHSCTCPNCGSDMRVVDEMKPPCFLCSSCGSSMEAAEQNYDTGSACPNCHRIFQGYGECPHCGYDLGSDFD